MTVRSAVVGCGDISAVHFDAIRALDGVELVGIAEQDPDRRGAATRRWGVPGFPDTAALLDAVQPDVVHITTPHHEHAGPAIMCLERGVDALVEKPLANTAAEGRRMVEASLHSSARLGVCFQNRYNATSEAMHRLLAGGSLGKVLGAAATVIWHRPESYYRDRSWRGTWCGGGGGLLMNQAIHTIDLAQWLLGDVSHVHGHASTRALGGRIEVEDTAELVMEHTSGVRTMLYATVGHAANTPVTLDIVAEKGTLSLRGELTVTYQNGTSSTIQERATSGSGRSYWGASHQRLISDFYSGLGSRAQFWINATEAEKSLRIIKEVYRQSYPDRSSIVS